MRTSAILLLLGLPLSQALAQAPAKPAQPAAPAAPETGPFTLEQATAGLQGKGALSAALAIVIKDKPAGTLHCELFADKAPLAVANFVGLARGVRPFKDVKTGQWVKRPLYDGMLVHRIIPGYVLQAGDPQCQNNPGCASQAGYGDPGYSFPDEVDSGLRPVQGGVLAMANRGPDTNGSQFFITEEATPWLLGQQTIFGQCAEVELIKKITHLERGPRDFPKDPVTIKKVTITRKAK